MPLFQYSCTGCAKIIRKLTSKRQDFIECDCGQKATFLLPTSVNTLVFEVKDPNTGKAVRKGIKEKLQDRMNKHHDRYMIEEKVDKYGLDEASRLGWTKKIKRI